MKFPNDSLRTSNKIHLRVFRTLVLSAIILSLITYAFLRLLFFDFSIPASEETINILKTISTGTIIGLAAYSLFFMAEMAEALFRSWPIMRPFTKLALPLSVIGLLLFLSSCTGSVSIGIKKDFSTGLVSDYKNMEPEKVMLVMNDEVLNHTDIPLGESFLLVNDKIKGMKVKDGKVSVGCSLKISDLKGNILLQEKDLFKGHDIFNEKDASYLKCTVSTGKPMEWEEKYDVAVVFWDKYGDGKIENKVTIRCIDMP